MRQILILATLLLGVTVSSCSINPDVLHESSEIESNASVNNTLEHV
jgi:hypothetical protein